MKAISPKVLMTVLLVLSCFSLFAQAQKVDSLINVLKSSTEKDSVLTCHELVIEWADVDNHKAMSYCEMAYATSSRLRDSVLISKSIMYIGLIYRRLERLDTAIQIYESIIPYMKRNKIYDQLIFIHSSLGGIHLLMGKYDQALRYYDLALKSPVIEEKLKIKKTIMFNIGLLYYKLNDQDRALEFSFKALDMLREMKSKWEVDQLLINISQCYIAKKDFGSAERYLEQALKECEGSCSQSTMMQHAFANGMLYIEKGQLPHAESFLKKAYSIARALSDSRFQLDIIERLSEIYNRQRKFAEAKKLLVKADSIMPLVAFGREKEQIYKQFIKVYRETNDYKRLSEYQQRLIELEESSFGWNLTTNLMKAEAEHQQREAAVKMEAQAEVIALKDQLISWQRIVIATTTLTLITLTILLIVTIRGSHRRKNANILLEEKVKQRTEGFAMALSELGQSMAMNVELTKKMIHETNHTMTAIGVLCYLIKEDAENNQHYVADIKNLSDKVIGNLRAFQLEDRRGEKVGARH